MNRKCVCKVGFVRNRSSQKCVYDCSLCDMYSTKCITDGCICKPEFIPKKHNSTSCELGCNSDTDCPTLEICNSSKSCICPYTKENGVCHMKSSEYFSSNKSKLMTIKWFFQSAIFVIAKPFVMMTFANAKKIGLVMEWIVVITVHCALIVMFAMLTKGVSAQKVIKAIQIIAR